MKPFFPQHYLRDLFILHAVVVCSHSLMYSIPLDDYIQFIHSSVDGYLDWVQLCYYERYCCEDSCTIF